MILKLLFALIFTNIIGVVYDWIRAGQSIMYRKRYVNSTLGIVLMIFVRNISELYEALFFIYHSPENLFLKSTTKIVEISVFVLTIYYMIDYHNENRNNELIHLGIVAFVFWAITYSYMSVTSNFLYLNDNIKNDRELRMSEGTASKSDKTSLFFLNLITSPLSVHIYVLALITTFYTYFIGNWLG